MSGTTNTFTANAATQRNILPRGGLQLLGVAGTPDALRALVRHPGGRIQTVTPGDSLRQGTVEAIGTDYLILQNGTRLRRLNLPGAPLPEAA